MQRNSIKALSRPYIAADREYNARVMVIQTVVQAIEVLLKGGTTS